MSYILEHIASFPGVEIRKNYLRAYPHGSLAAHLLGNMGEITKKQLKEQRFKGYSAGDVVGQGGLEWSYDRWLRGRDGVAKVEVDAFGRPKSHAIVPGGRLPQPGDTLVTTLDAKVQAKAEEALQYGIRLAQTGGQVAPPLAATCPPVWARRLPYCSASSALACTFASRVVTNVSPGCGRRPPGTIACDLGRPKASTSTLATPSRPRSQRS